ncbi:amidase domain-containing protein [Clostridium lundense]|uniref:amidase domain-containing protein n=1 Tax=Clostridium lundense TaxID=319475 RepID=UPI000486316C|nr:amidase domain-containing protein [Clostridium lundense]
MGKLVYNRDDAVKYAEQYAETFNKKYPYYLGFDCTNFISQVIRAGGILPFGNIWSLYSSWFCNTNNHEELTDVAITWRAGRYFRLHWGNENGVGINRAKKYIEVSAKEFVDDFNKYYDMLQIGDVIQYAKGNTINKYPFHMQVIHKKGYNPSVERNDLFMAQHSINIKNSSLYELLCKYSKENIYVYIYIID